VRRLLGVATLGAAAACGSTTQAEPPSSSAVPSPTRAAAAATAGPELLLDFESLMTDSGGVVPRVENRGTGAVSTQVVTLARGRARLGEGSGGSHGLRLPEFHAGVPAPAAVLMMLPEDGTDVFSPDAAAFRFGADFNLDERSHGSEADNGDNLIQRGLYGDPAQFKIQIDRGVPSCRVVGQQGEAFVEAARPVVRKHWFRVTCERRGDRLELTLDDLTTSAAGETYVTRAATGEIRMADARVPLSLGGKLSPSGEITASSTDQFNGLVDNVSFETVD
jgi:hypothetical protein